MGKRRTGEYEGTSKDSVEFKRRKPAQNFGFKDVDIDVEKLNNSGVVKVLTHVSNKESKSFRHIKNQIQEDDELHFGSSCVIRLYTAFKEALLRLICEVEKVVSSPDSAAEMILIHGVPMLGKTSLARCLSYYLAQYAGKEESLRYIQLDHSAQLDNGVLTNSLIEESNEKYVIIDQLNTHTIRNSCFFESTQQRSTKHTMPLFLFTSGHYSPSEDWLAMAKRGKIMYKVITMKGDIGLVERLKRNANVPENGTMSNADILKVTTSYSGIRESVFHLLQYDSNPTEDSLLAKVYPGAKVDVLKQNESIHFLGLIWHDFFLNGLPDKEDFKREHCKLTPQYAQYLAYLISKIKDPVDEGINALLDLDGAVDYESKSKGFVEFKHDSYYYYFLNRGSLHDILKSVIEEEDSLQKMHECHLRVFNSLVRSGSSQYNFVVGGLFELIIDNSCRIESKVKTKLIGMAYGQDFDFVSVESYEYVSTEEELCEIPLKHENAKGQMCFFWCILNVSGKSPFKGYDFAHIETKPIRNKPVIAKLQLFQASVSPRNKTTEKKLIMTDVLDKVKSEVVKRNLVKLCDVDDVVIPYVVHHTAEVGEIELPYRYKSQKLKAKLLRVPKRLLCNESWFGK